MFSSIKPPGQSLSVYQNQDSTAGPNHCKRGCGYCPPLVPILALAWQPPVPTKTGWLQQSPQSNSPTLFILGQPNSL